MRKILILLFILACTPQISLSQNTILHCGKFIDGNSDEAKLQMSVVVSGKKIADIKSGYIGGEENDVVINLKDKTVLPGLMDMHTHLSGQLNPKSYSEKFFMNREDYAYRSVPFAERTLMAGFTTVREVGGIISTALRNAINKGYVVGPRIFSAGKSLATTGGHADPTNGLNAELMGNPDPKDGVVNGVVDARKAVRQRYKNGADLIKITATGGVLSVAKSGQNPQFTEEEIRAIVETARDYDMHVAAHAHGAEGMKRAIRAGVHSIEHGTFMDDEAMQLMKKHGTYHVPTILAGITVAEKAAVDGFLPDIVRPKAAEIGPKIVDTFRRAYETGVKIAFGTDSGVSKHGENTREFELMVEGGMPPMEAIQAATRVAAELLGVQDELGTLEKGKTADIIAVDGDPLANISSLREVAFVMKEGKIYKQNRVATN
ncbi:amidohydrolase family protein [candidate division KSB1 bacterium]|nr:amidohydrolase family protein [candidate division KSB1 bacterium]NIR70466.1 amidohydrolase family protein [candidate division KSB1 bacterium]NIS23196.1 amidohydrolase family protein [candidate division KSB1 bacterium]NIT70056.1 amidohydrolase family protein [candidate division KSB1 bacterium]NIU23693.1 amidohydrolase family protein [candidate division KSB1 bacterium]